LGGQEGATIPDAGEIYAEVGLGDEVGKGPQLGSIGSVVSGQQVKGITMQAGGHEIFQGLGGMGVFGKQADNGAGRHFVLGVREND
jgi:hypothetical protein